MITIENCTVTETESNYQVTANEGYVIYRKDRMQAYEDYKALRAENPERYPKRSILTFFRFSFGNFRKMGKNSAA